MIKQKKSLFDDIFQLQNAAPDIGDIDPEDPEDGLKAAVVENIDDIEDVGKSNLRIKAAVIDDDPKYKGRKTSRKDLYSDDEDEDTPSFFNSKGSLPEASSEGEDSSEGDENDDAGKDSDFSEEAEGDGDDESGEHSDDMDDDEDEDDDDKIDSAKKKDVDAKVTAPSKSDDVAKGQAVSLQLGVWDQLIKTRISLQKVVSLCNQLPQSDTWADFEAVEGFKHEAKNAHSSVRNVVTSMLEAQKNIAGVGIATRSESDEEITSESEGEESSSKNGKTLSLDALDQDDPNTDSEEDMEEDESVSDTNHLSKNDSLGLKRQKLKRKLNFEEVEEVISKQHKEYQSFRNDTLSKWDEKTRLTNVKIKSKNFSAFEMSVLKQIEQVLVNRDRLIKRIHQQRTAYRILGQPESQDKGKAEDQVPVDDDEEVEVQIKQTKRQEVPINYEIIDDNDFYHVCLKDLIEMKQNDETDPALANKQWLEIQRLRNKPKKKVDTKASKGRKIRYNVSEKLRNYMGPFDKSSWTDEQKDDLFKAIFGGSSQEDESNTSTQKLPTSSIIIGL